MGTTSSGAREARSKGCLADRSDNVGWAVIAGVVQRYARP
jgi:hypothetical protein